jgi:hypothetical protein
VQTGLDAEVLEVELSLSNVLLCLTLSSVAVVLVMKLQWLQLDLGHHPPRVRLQWMRYDLQRTSFDGGAAASETLLYLQVLLAQQHEWLVDQKLV